MMKIARLLCALWVCGPLVLEASAAESSAHNRASVPVDGIGQAAAGSTQGSDAVKTGRPVSQESTRVDSGKIGGSTGRSAAVTVSPPHAKLARSNADRLHSLLSTKARGPIVPTSNRRAAPRSAAASGNVAARARGLPGASPQGLPAPPVAASAARVPPTVKAAAVRGPNIGGPRAAGPGRLGGPAIGRAANNAAIDGTRVRRKF